MNINTKNIQRHNGLGFWLHKDGSRSAEYFGRVFTFVKSKAGWNSNGVVFRTLADAADFIVDAK